MLELSLKLESQTFFSGDPIPIKVYLVNTGKEEVTIDGIRPLSGAQTPPSLRLARNTVKKWTTRTAFAAGVKKELIDTPKIRIKAGQSCILMDTDLLELEKEGFLFREMKSSSFVHYNPKLEEGTYTISATFSQEAFTSTTDKVDFHIVKNTSDQPKEDK